MYQDAVRRLEALRRRRLDGLLKGARIGLEKESLRVDARGTIARTPHPPALGSALAHPYITTDYSEALLEFITPPFTALAETLDFLCDLHRFALRRLPQGEILWATSMPCMVAGDPSIPIAEYGTSNVGRMKHVYRRGLSNRYGRVMQTIAGIHFNYSLPEEFWPAYRGLLGREEHDPQATISAGYFALIRNFQRLGWIIPFLFGSSPAICKSFLAEPLPGFEEFDRGTWHLPYATSLRMSDIGYKNRAQEDLRISYDGVDPYVESLSAAIETPYPPYEAIGVKVDGEYRQLNANLLQIENEYYSFIRPKQVARSGEKPTVALRRRGVQYVEVRALDVNAFDPLGAHLTQLRFVEAFLVLCLLTDSPRIDAEGQRELEENQRRVATRGRDPALELGRDGRSVSLREWAAEILMALEPVCEALDSGEPDAPYRAALAGQRRALEHPALTPSARMLAEMRERGEPFFRFAMRRSQEHAEWFRARPLDREREKLFEQEAQRSLSLQAGIEAADTSTFEEYLHRYLSQDLDDRERALA